MPEADKVRNGSVAAKGIGPKSGRSQAQTAWLNVVFPALSECLVLAQSSQDKAGPTADTVQRAKRTFHLHRTLHILVVCDRNMMSINILVLACVT